MDKITTIKDVAQLSGFSIATVSRVVNKKGYINKDTEEKVNQVIRKLDYTPNHIARCLVKRKSETIGLILLDITNPFFPQLASAIENSAQQNKYSVMYCNSDNNVAKVTKCFKLLKDRSVDGIIIAGDINVDHVRDLINNDIPIVVIDSYTDDVPVHSVNIDNTLGAQLATLHLVEQGYKRIAHIQGSIGYSTANHRYQGYLNALTICGIPYDPVLVQPGDFHIQSGYEAMLRLLALSNPPDAVFVGNDLMALGAIEAVYEKNFRIPQDIGIVGFDGIPLTKISHPHLTTVEQPINDIGVISTEILINAIRNSENKHNSFEKIVLNPVLKIRNTSLRDPSSHSICKD